VCSATDCWVGGGDTYSQAGKRDSDGLEVNGRPSVKVLAALEK
jgi:hypothetical protein